MPKYHLLLSHAYYLYTFVIHSHARTHQSEHSKFYLDTRFLQILRLNIKISKLNCIDKSQSFLQGSDKYNSIFQSKALDSNDQKDVYTWRERDIYLPWCFGIKRPLRTTTLALFQPNPDQVKFEVAQTHS
jgi:hypothetical protein